MIDDLTKVNPDIFDTKNTLVNFSSSILSYFGAKPFHSSIKEVDEVLKGHKKVAVFLFDGASEYNLSLFPRTTRFITSHKLKTIFSVNPATTVACTTAFLSGKFPIENAYLGWSLNFPSIGPVDAFSGEGSYDEVKHGSSFMSKYAPYRNIASILQEVGVKAATRFFYPIEEDGPKSYKEADQKYSAFFKEGGQFLYGYFPNPDKTIHHRGVKSFSTWRRMAEIVSFLKRFTKHNPDVLVFAFADHGLIDVKNIDLSDYPEIEETLAYPISIDARIRTFFVKEGQKERFVELFNKYLGNDFYLFSKEEILSVPYFGEGEKSEQALSFLGDYFAVAKGNAILKQSLGKPLDHFKAHHSGITIEEKNILLSVYNN